MGSGHSWRRRRKRWTENAYRKQQEYISKMTEVLRAGAAVLSSGAPSRCRGKCIRLMEDSPLFNAGKGAVLRKKGKNEMDASIMDGQSFEKRVQLQA